MYGFYVTSLLDFVPVVSRVDGRIYRVEFKCFGVGVIVGIGIDVAITVGVGSKRLIAFV